MAEDKQEQPQFDKEEFFESLKTMSPGHEEAEDREKAKEMDIMNKLNVVGIYYNPRIQRLEKEDVERALEILRNQHEGGKYVDEVIERFRTLTEFVKPKP
ncbi:MAG: hypothetical protein UV74_C0013G0038 [Candidatus Woesebacteria bacterium GW2011_GWB1_43_14]|uniref:Uncharacterized protein n=1 Tax=Candidatus Woesebacteria bacterium GW2011_GWB1_43_14 TaxID=1618578 RepID=A0A0G1FPF9_9BACT|nr:MAG: hypothetical protein UV51_C0009G0041 [Candidatus Woesebacteria bacterium GW2011_GWC1_42_9]KKS96916.1 MAG: hypothetical protein UV74_C0013G0038 [Candidatus Woesebacteria bacterium GW2011_GWB1_43_14]